MKRWMAVLPLSVLLLIGVITAVQLYNPQKATFEKADAARVSRQAPSVDFPVFGGEGLLNFAAMGLDKPIAVNLFASWCTPCRVEHPLLMQLGAQFPQQVYGIAYKDSDAATRDFLDTLGNPYVQIATDKDGQGGLDFGLTGVPETFIIDRDGTIILHVRGVLDRESVDKIAEILAR